jgi:spermidine synthase
MELVWYRMLGPILGGSTYSFGLILVVALFGIGLGSAAFRLLFRFLPVTVAALAATCALEALFLAVPLALGDGLALLALKSRMEMAGTFRQLVQGWTTVTAIVVFPAAFVSGVQFPLLIALLGKGREHLGREIGVAFACNTFGAIAGSLAGAFGVLPELTAPATWTAVVVMLAGLSIALCGVGLRQGGMSFHAGRRFVALVLAIGASMAAVTLALQMGPTAVWRHSGIGAGRADVPTRDHNGLRKWMHTQRRRLIWEAEGVESSIAISAGDGLSLIVNGKSDGNSIGDAGTQIGLGLLGGLLHPGPKRALVIGLGTGETAGWLADMPPIERVDVVELEPAVAEMARRCSDVNRNVLDNPKVRMIYNDGREVLLASQETYDVIVSEPSNPYRAGIATLYTREFYRAVRGRLAEDGRFLQWVQAYEIDLPTVATVLKTLRTSFRRVEIWQTKPSDLLLVCSNSDAAYDGPRLQQRLQSPVVKQALLAAWRVDDLEGFLAHYVGGGKLVESLTAPESVPINTDDRTVLEYGLARTVGRKTRFSVEELRRKAVDENAHRPAVRGVDVNWERVEERRLAMHVHFETLPERPALLTSTLRKKGGALAAYLFGEYRTVLANWPDLKTQPQCPIELVVLLHSMAESGLPLPSAWMRSVTAIAPVDAATIAALSHFKRKQRAVSLNDVERGLTLLHAHPWATGLLSNRLLALSLDLTDGDPAAAARLLPLMTSHFAGYRFDDRRRAAAVFVAGPLGTQAVVDRLRSVEPNVPWSEFFLETRAATYAKAKHPLAETARQELLEFRNQAGGRPSEK